MLEMTNAQSLKTEDFNGKPASPSTPPSASSNSQPKNREPDSATFDKDQLKKLEGITREMRGVAPTGAALNDTIRQLQETEKKIQERNKQLEQYGE